MRSWIVMIQKIFDDNRFFLIIFHFKNRQCDDKNSWFEFYVYIMEEWMSMLLHRKIWRFTVEEFFWYLTRNQDHKEFYEMFSLSKHKFLYHWYSIFYNTIKVSKQLSCEFNSSYEWNCFLINDVRGWIDFPWKFIWKIRSLTSVFDTVLKFSVFLLHSFFILFIFYTNNRLFYPTIISFNMKKQCYLQLKPRTPNNVLINIFSLFFLFV